MSQWLTFSLNGATYALNIVQLKEVLPHREITPIPANAPHILGVINLRGVIVSVLDIARHLSLPSSAVTANTRIIIVEQTQQILGLMVDSVTEVINVDPTKIVLNAEGEHPWLYGIYQHQNELIIMVDVKS